MEQEEAAEAAAFSEAAFGAAWPQQASTERVTWSYQMAADVHERDPRASCLQASLVAQPALDSQGAFPGEAVPENSNSFVSFVFSLTLPR